MISVNDFDLGLSAMSGQPLAFYSKYSKEGNQERLTYDTPKGTISILASKRGERSLLNYAYSGEHTASSARKEITERFALEDDVAHVYRSINTDSFMGRAITELNGLRVTKNDPWETTLCFVVSQFNNIKRIRGIVQNLSNAFGEERELGESRVRLFPTPEALASASLQEIRKCGTGFRDRYIRKVAIACASKVDLNELYDMEYEDAKERLLRLDGIGDKVADCILLFGYRKLESFPIDTWVKRVVEAIYFKGRKRNARQIHGFANSRWGALQGYSNQYLFWAGRTNGIGK